jgi:putative flippase GtrA
MKNIFRQLGWFFVVGCAAAGTHWVCAVASVVIFDIRPALANFIGWSIAVIVSFFGHYFFTFRHQKKTLLPAIRRFLAISVFGFSINELTFMYFLRHTGIPYYWLLAIILVAIAVLTFVFSRYWAFDHKA